MARLRRLFAKGTITSNPLSNVATTISSAEFAALPVVAAPDVMALTLDPDGQDGTPEVVWVTAHTAAATTVTVERGKETTDGAGAARQHGAGTKWVHAPTPTDFSGVALGSSSLRPAASALDIKLDQPAATDGLYWIRRRNGAVYQAWCDMTSDGGGWIRAGYLSAGADQPVGLAMFSDYGTPVLDASEVTTGSVMWAMDISNRLIRGGPGGWNELAYTLDAKVNRITDVAAGKLLVLRFGAGSLLTHPGPLHPIVDQPSPTLNGAKFEWRTAFANSWAISDYLYQAGNATNHMWYPYIVGGGGYLCLMYRPGAYGFYWGFGMGGNNTWNHYGHLWVR